MKASVECCQWSVVSKDDFDLITSGVKRYKMQKTIFMLPQQTTDNEQRTTYIERFAQMKYKIIDQRAKKARLS
jgi:hypothetical protein